MLIQFSVDFPSREKRICGVHVDIGIVGRDPDLVPLVQPHCDGSAALLVGFLAVGLMISASIFHQFWISHIATADRKALREDVQTRSGSSEAVVASVETIALIIFQFVEFYDGPRTIGCCARWNGCKCYTICSRTCKTR